MQQINIITSKENQEVVRQLTKKLVPGTPENVIARIALGYSLSTGKLFDQDEFNDNKYDSKGKEYKDTVLFDSSYKNFYIALICQAYNISKDSDKIPRYVKLHIDHGLEEMNKFFVNNNGVEFFDFLQDTLPQGIRALDSTPISLNPVPNKNQHIRAKSEFLGPINIVVGRSSDGKNITLPFNTRSNPHVAIAGRSGSGKTQFALEFLSQLHEQTNGQVNFLFLDFKGLSDDNRDSMKSFFVGTNTTFISPGNSIRFPLNPISFIDNVNESHKSMGIDKLTDTIIQYSNLGSKQGQILRDAIVEAFGQHSDGKYPSFEEIYHLMSDDAKANLGIIRKLGEYNFFEQETSARNSFLDKNYYFSLPSNLDNTTRLTSVFLVINYILHVFTNMGNAAVSKDGARGIRYVLMIDEAHNLFRDKKSLGTLEVLLRQMRSSGVSVVLLSQSIKDYDTATFDFSSECATAFLLPINNLEPKHIKKFLGLSEKTTQRLSHRLNELKDGCAISNIDRENIDVFKIAQYFENHE